MFVARHRDAQPTLTLIPPKPQGRGEGPATMTSIETYVQFALEGIVIILILYYVTLLYRRQRKTNAVEDKAVLLVGVLICIGYPVLLYDYYMTTGIIWSLGGLYAVGYYAMVILTAASLIYSFRRVEQNEARLEVDLDRKARELVDSEIEQRGAVERITKEHTVELIDGARQMSTVIRDNVKKPLKTMRQALYHLREDPEGAELALKTMDENLNLIEGAIDELSTSTSFGQLKRTLIDIGDLVSMVIKETRIPEGVSVETDLGHGFNALNVDASRLRRAIGNIVNNAIEAMPNGGTLHVKVANEKNALTVSISDTGVGIPEQARTLVFKPFYTTKPRGLGLGLFYSKDIIEAHGGKIRYNSTPGKGTTFTIELPLIY